ncbi:MAG TPA: hypothetical protein VEH84_07370 [Alphaproteobacteria bacterium]|nr:hypothetical protein [Alphaproteobacteria bacterium]
MQRMHGIALAALLLAGCAINDRTVTERTLCDRSVAGALGPLCDEPVVPAAVPPRPVYCYPTLGEPTCFAAPRPDLGLPVADPYLQPVTP